ISFHAVVAFLLRLTKPAQRRRVTEALRDNTTMIFLASQGPRASVFDSPQRDQQLQAAVSGRKDRRSANATTRDEDSMRCIHGASETWKQWSVQLNGSQAAC